MSASSSTDLLALPVQRKSMTTHVPNSAEKGASNTSNEDRTSSDFENKFSDIFQSYKEITLSELSLNEAEHSGLDTAKIRGDSSAHGRKGLGVTGESIAVAHDWAATLTEAGQQDVDHPAETIGRLPNGQWPNPMEVGRHLTLPNDGGFGSASSGGLLSAGYSPSVGSLRGDASLPAATHLSTSTDHSATGNESFMAPGGKGLPPSPTARGVGAYDASLLASLPLDADSGGLHNLAALHRGAYKVTNPHAMPLVSSMNLSDSLPSGQAGILQGAAHLHALGKQTASAPSVELSSVAPSSLAPIDGHSSLSEVDPLPTDLLRINSGAPSVDRTAIQPAVTVSLQRFTGAPGWDQALGQRILWMAEQGMNQAELRLDPPQLGSVTVRIAVNDDQAQLQFQAQHPAAREALESALPKLREMFAERGLELGDADISGQGQSADGEDSSTEEHANSERASSTHEEKNPGSSSMENPSTDEPALDVAQPLTDLLIVDEFV